MAFHIAKLSPLSLVTCLGVFLGYNVVMSLKIPSIKISIKRSCPIVSDVPVYPSLPYLSNVHDLRVNWSAQHQLNIWPSLK